MAAQPLLRHADALIFAADERGEAGRMSVIAFAIRIANAAIAFLSQVLLARWMGSFEYGIFVLVWVTMVIVGSLSCFGFHTSVIRFIPEYREKGLWAELRGILLASRLLALLSSTVVAGIGLVGLWLLSPMVESYYVAPFYLGLVCVPMIALSDTLQGIARANAWALWALSPTYLVRPVLVLVCMAAALLLGLPAAATTAIAAAIVATYVTTVWQLASVATRADRKAERGPKQILLRDWIAVSMPIFLVESFFFLLTNADVLMVGRFLEPDDVAVYYATVKTLALVHFVYFAVKTGAAQRFARISHGSDPDELASFARETVSWTFWPSVFMAGVVLLLGEPMLGLFGPGFDAGYPLLFALVIGVVARAAVGPAESLLTMTGNQNVCAAVFALTLALNVALNFILIPQHGLWGAAIATTISMVFEAGALSLVVWRRLSIVMLIFVPARKHRST